jgi:hypothetical protein
MAIRSTSKSSASTAPLATFARDFHKQADALAADGTTASERLLQWAIEQARTPSFAKMDEAKFEKLIKPISDAVIAKLPLASSTRPTYRAYFKTGFLAASNGVATDKNGLRLQADDLRPKCIKLGIIAPSKRGAPSKGPKPASNASQTPQAQMAKDAQASNVTPLASAVASPRGKVLTDAQYDVAVAAFCTTLGLSGSNVNNVRLAFGPSSLEQTLRLLASTYG